MPLDEIISACVKGVTKSVLEICLPFASSDREVAQLTSNIREVSEQKCRDFFSNRIPTLVPPSQLTPRTAESVSKIVFSEIMDLVIRGGNQLRCQELMRPNGLELPNRQKVESDLFSKMVELFSLPFIHPISLSNPETQFLDQLLVNTMITCLVGGGICYLFGPAKIVEAGGKITRLIGLRMQPLELCGKIFSNFIRIR